MTHRFDLDAYFERIGYTGRREPTPDVLRAITDLHPRTIPFENLDPWLRVHVCLDSASLQRKLVLARRGGYCFEQNLLLQHALTTLGFDTTGLAARVLWRTSEDAIPPRGHMLLLVRVASDVPYIVDVGFGVLTPTAPLSLEPGIEHTTSLESFRLEASRGEFTLQARLGGIWRSLYRFDLQEQFLPDYEITNWYLSNHPASRFVTQLIVTRAGRGCRYTLHDSDFVVRHADGRSERRALRTAAALRETLTGTFGLNLPDGPALDAALERLAAHRGVAVLDGIEEESHA